MVNDRYAAIPDVQQHSGCLTGNFDFSPEYAGRLHREQAGKTGVRIIDLVDTGHPALLRMWDKRQRGYRAMGYRVGEMDSSPT